MSEAERWRGLAILWATGTIIWIPILWPCAIISFVSAMLFYRGWQRRILKGQP